MSALHEILGTGAPPHVLEYAGKRYVLRAIDWDMKAELERHLYSVRVAALAVVRTSMDPPAYQARLDALTRAYEEGEFALESPAGQAYYLGEAVPAAGAAWTDQDFRKAAKTLPGRLYFMGLIFGCSPGEALRLVRGRPVEVAALLKTVIKESLLVAEEGEKDSKNPPSPGSGPGGTS